MCRNPRRTIYKSTTETIQLSANASSLAYRQLMAINSALIEAWKDILNGKGPNQGDLADKISDFTVQSDKAWELLLTATTFSTYTVVVFPKDDNERATTLNMTAAQKATLTKKLENTFGNSLKGPLKDVSSTFESCGWSLYSYLNKPEWKFLNK